VKLRAILLATGMLAACTLLLAQHTPLTSQHLFNGLLINPAYAGSRDALAANLTYRQQWAGFDGAPVTQLLSVHAPVNKRKVGLGLILYNDRIGVSNETGFFTNYAYRLRFPNGRLAFGIGAGITMLNSNLHTVAIQDRDDAAFAGPILAAARPNFSTGVFYYTDNWFVGASVPFILMHRMEVTQDGYVISDAQANMQAMLTGGYVFQLSHHLRLKPSTLVRHTASAGLQADLSTHIIFQERLWLGMSYRTDDALVAMLEILPTEQWRFGYAYDMGLNALRGYHMGSHGLMIQYEFGYRIRARSPRHF